MTTAARPPVDPGAEATGSGAAATYREALQRALADAIATAAGTLDAGSPLRQARLAVVAGSPEGARPGWFDGESEQERAWVLLQLEGFLDDYQIVRKQADGSGAWQVDVRVRLAEAARAGARICIELRDGDLREWQLERSEEGGRGRPFDRCKGRFEGPKIGSYLRRSGAVSIASLAAADAGAAPAAATGANSLSTSIRRVPSHRVTLRWQPLVVRSTVERPNPARPKSGPRPEYMSGGSIQVAMRIEDLLRGTVVLDETIVEPGLRGRRYPRERLDAYMTELVDRAKAVVARRIVFALAPPVVLRKWAGAGGSWFVEARLAKLTAAGFVEFAVGNDGSLAGPDWQPLGRARLVGGNSVRCTFELVGLDELSRIQLGKSQVRPVR
ncbi:MAG: hypothetical protein AB8H80_00975 [Planctomycetota bacterium]